jgi:hypothetical protein
MIGRSFFFDVGELLERGRSNDLQKNEFIFKRIFDILGKPTLSISDNWIGNLKVKKLATLMKSKLL